MENASKALIMAGGILITLMILGALMLMFNSLSSYQKQNDDLNKTSQIAEFNNQFMPYDKEDITLMELKTLYNKIVSIEKNQEVKIKNNIETIFPKNEYDINTDFKVIKEDEKITRRFKCTEIKYDKNGRINEINFQETTKSN